MRLSWAAGLMGVASVVGAEGCSRPLRELATTTTTTTATATTTTTATANSAQACEDPGSALIFVSPDRPVRGQPVRVVAVLDHAVDATLSVSSSAGAPVTTPERHGGPPYFWMTQVDEPGPGRWRAALARDPACGGDRVSTRDFVVSERRVAPPATPRTALWFTRAAWSPALENLYSAWVEHLFESPLEEQPSWSVLHEVLRDRSRNFLFDHLGVAEDEQGVAVRPDCADLPYFLRAYFSFKLGLPFGWSHCSRGDNGSPPTCSDFATSADPFPPVDGGAQTPPPWADPDREKAGPWENNVKRLGELFRTTLADAVQSGAGRTPPDDEDSDYYPVALSVETLRPGTIFADPYGHVLVVVQRIPQTASAGGVLLAVDGQPDGTVARKRFWRGNFLFAIDPALGGPGFKRFRPIQRDKITGKFRQLRNEDLRDFSATDQYAGGVEGFYDKVEDVLSPSPQDPTQALIETIQALEEQVKTRVTSVENGRKFLASGKGAADMPDGAKIFETAGDWEDFSTPSRDLRLLIAIDVARGLPARVARRPERYAMPAGRDAGQVRADLEARLAQELRARRFRYVRTDGSEWELSLEDVHQREAALEMAYNPNDCVEQRWGAPPGGAEAATCLSHAPGPQVAKMQGYRSWFHDRRRPPR